MSDLFQFRCTACKYEFLYDRSENYLADSDDENDHKYPDDWYIDCPECGNCEQVGNNKPGSFEQLDRGEHLANDYNVYFGMEGYEIMVSVAAIDHSIQSVVDKARKALTEKGFDMVNAPVHDIVHN